MIDASITIDTIAGDGVVNAEESGKDIAVTGKVGGDVKVGDTVTLTVNGQDYTGKVVDLGNGSLGYSINVPGAELAKDSNVHASVTATDDAGNSKTAEADKGYSVDTDIDASITIDTIAGDGVVNAEESGKDIAVTGKVGGDVKVGDTVTLTVNGQDYTGKVVDLGNGSLGYSINVPGAELAKDSNVHASVTATDDAGNSKTAEADKGYSVDTEIDASITIDTIAGDGVVNAEESGKDIAVTGKVGGDVKVGDTVTLTVNGQDYTGKVVDLGNGSLGYSINVPGSELAKDSNVHASVTATDDAGNSKTAEADKGYSVDTDIDASITIDTIAGDGIVNAEESGKDIAVTGKVGGDVKVGDTVTLTVNGQDYTGKVVDLGNGSLGYSINVPGSELAKDSNVHASVTATDDAGNSKTAEADKGYSVDTDIDASITIDTIAGDGIVNAEESGKDIAVTGKVGGDVKVGDTVTLTVHGKTYTGQVVDQGGGKLGYSINVPGAELAEDSNVHASVTATDNAGNSKTAEADKGYGIDLEAKATITINTIAGDDVINATEKAKTIPVTGTVGGDAKVGDTVTLTVHGKTYTGQVVDQGGGKLGYSINVPGSELA
ncbi:Ig-like domain-containing protein, partial [Achromobacter marplatensis]